MGTEAPEKVSSNSTASQTLATIYHVLPSEAKYNFFNQHILSLLDSVSQDVRDRLLVAARDEQAKYAGMPDLDISNRGSDITRLQRNLEANMSSYNEISLELSNTLSQWIPEIWSVVYEYRTNFDVAHRSLLVATSTMQSMIDMFATPSGCRCFLMKHPIDIIIKSVKTHQVVRMFQFDGFDAFERVLLWVWRDLFVSMLSSPSAKVEMIPKMLDEIQDLLGWKSVYSMLFGSKSPFDLDAEEEDVDVVEDREWTSQYPTRVVLRHMRSFHALHWTPSIDVEVKNLRNLVATHLLGEFRHSPDLILFRSANKAATPGSQIRTQMLTVLEEIALTSSDAYVAALNIYFAEEDTARLCKLLDSGLFLLRPCNASTLQNALRLINRRKPNNKRLFEITVHEIVNAARSIHASLLRSFARLDEPERRNELEIVMRRPAADLGRINALNDWIRNITTPSTRSDGPMAALADMMGFPMHATTTDEDDIDRHDQKHSMDDRLFVENFRTWTEFADGTVKNAHLSARAYHEIVAFMPYLRAPEAVKELCTKLVESGRDGACDALNELDIFGKNQRRALAKLRSMKRKADSKQPPNPPQMSAFSSGHGSAGPATSFPGVAVEVFIDDLD